MKKIPNGRFIAIFLILRQYFDLVGMITYSIMAAGYCRVRSCYIIGSHSNNVLTWFIKNNFRDLFFLSVCPKWRSLTILTDLKTPSMWVSLYYNMGVSLEVILYSTAHVSPRHVLAHTCQ